MSGSVIKKTPKKKNKNVSLKSSKTKKKYPGFIQMFINMEWYGKALFLGVGLWALYMSTIQIWLNQRVALNYLQKKYNKEFTVRSDNSAPSWIGKPPTYHGLAKVKDGSDDVEFVVVCGLDDLVCSDMRLESYWGYLEEEKIKNMLQFNEADATLRVEITTNKIYDGFSMEDSFDRYYQKYGPEMIKTYVVSIGGAATDLSQAKNKLKQLIKYLDSKFKKGSIYYDVIYDSAKCSCRYGIDDAVRNDIDSCFKYDNQIKGEEKCQ